MNISWREPLWLLFLCYPLLLMVWHYSRQRKQVHHYADTALLPWVQIGATHWKRHLRPVLWCCFWCLMTLALAGPRLPLENSEQQLEPNKTIMVVVDVSHSMQAVDILPNRLQRAKIELHELLQMIQASRVGIIVYAAQPHLLVPTTFDMKAVRFYSEKLDTLVLPTLGSDPSAALQYAEKQLLSDSTSNPSLPRIILWLTDGDIALKQQAPLKARVQHLKQAEIPLYILGIGTEDGEAIPLLSHDKTIKKWLYHQGKIVRSRLNSALLQQLSTLGEGRYSSVKNDSSDWHSLYTQGIEKAFKKPINTATIQQWHELYGWVLFPALFLLFILITLPRRLLTIILLLSLPIIQLIQPAKANTTTDITLGAGIDAYRNEDYAQAIKHFSIAVFSAEKDTERARALHNLGNSYFQQGNYIAAIQVFRDALTYRPNHQPTLQNLHLGELVQTALERQLAAKQQEENNNMEGNRFENRRNILDGDQESTKTWGEAKSKPNHIDLPSLSLNVTMMEKLVNNGLKRLAQEGKNDISSWKKSQQSQYEARIALQKMDDNPAALWKRLFEIEEGFPASLDKPKKKLGVLPW